MGLPLQKQKAEPSNPENSGVSCARLCYAERSASENRMPHRFVIADVFTDRPFTGNQLAVFPEAQGLSDRAMQAIAREFNFAETTFVLPASDPRHACRVRIFTPKTELPFAGHPTVGTAAVLARLGLFKLAGGNARIVLEEGIGPVPVEIAVGNDAVLAHLVS